MELLEEQRHVLPKVVLDLGLAQKRKDEREASRKEGRRGGRKAGNVFSASFLPHDPPTAAPACPRKWVRGI